MFLIPPKEQSDRAFLFEHVAHSQNVSVVVHDIQDAINSYEMKFKRKRTRRPKDRITFDCQVEAIVCGLLYSEIIHPGSWQTISLSKRHLGMHDRYRPAAMTETLPSLLETMALPEFKLVEMIKGFRNPFEPSQSRQTVIQAGENLKRIQISHGLKINDFTYQATGDCIVLKAAKRSHWDKGSYLQYDDTPETSEYRCNLTAINDHLRAAHIEYLPSGVDGELIDVNNRVLTRYFNNGSFHEGGRLFGGFWQPMAKGRRISGIRINGEPVVTLDYGQMIPRILYGQAGVDLSGDAYSVPGLEQFRAGVKKIFNSMLHVDTPLIKKPKGSKRELPGHLSIEQITHLITEFHAPIADAFYQGKGMFYTYLESCILIDVLTQLVSRDITALPIHDAVVVSHKNEAEARKVMLQVFKDHTGIDGIVELDH